MGSTPSTAWWAFRSPISPGSRRRPEIRYIGFRHEASAGNAAAAAGFLTRWPGVCLTVSAPGFLNGLVALANATTNCFPMIQISGSSERPIVDLQRGDYEELDQLSAARPFAKAAYRIDRVEDIGRGVARAVRTAISGRPGGVYLDIPGAVLAEAMNAEAAARTLWQVVDPAPRHRLDCGTWGVMGIGQGYAIAAAVETGQPVIAVEGDSAFGFSGMEIETICRYRLPITVVILNNGGVYRGDEKDATGSDPAPTTLDSHAHHELIAKAFGGAGYHVTTPAELEAALTEAVAAGGPAVIDCVLDPAAGAESGHLTNLNPKSAATA